MDRGNWDDEASSDPDGVLGMRARRDARAQECVNCWSEKCPEEMKSLPEAVPGREAEGRNVSAAEVSKLPKAAGPAGPTCPGGKAERRLAPTPKVTLGAHGEPSDQGSRYATNGGSRYRRQAPAANGAGSSVQRTWLDHRDGAAKVHDEE